MFCVCVCMCSWGNRKWSGERLAFFEFAVCFSQSQGKYYIFGCGIFRLPLPVPLCSLCRYGCVSLCARELCADVGKANISLQFWAYKVSGQVDKRPAVALNKSWTSNQDCGAGVTKGRAVSNEMDFRGESFREFGGLEMGIIIIQMRVVQR